MTPDRAAAFSKFVKEHGGVSNLADLLLQDGVVGTKDTLRTYIRRRRKPDTTMRYERLYAIADATGRDRLELRREICGREMSEAEEVNATGKLSKGMVDVTHSADDDELRGFSEPSGKNKLALAKYQKLGIRNVYVRHCEVSPLQTVEWLKSGQEIDILIIWRQPWTMTGVNPLFRLLLKAKKKIRIVLVDVTSKQKCELEKWYTQKECMYHGNEGANIKEMSIRRGLFSQIHELADEFQAAGGEIRTVSKLIHAHPFSLMRVDNRMLIGLFSYTESGDNSPAIELDKPDSPLWIHFQQQFDDLFNDATPLKKNGSKAVTSK